MNHLQPITHLLSRTMVESCPRITRSKSRLSCAELSQLMETVLTVTLALSLTVITSSKRRSTFLLDTRPSFANSSMKALTVLMEIDANSSIRPSLTKSHRRKLIMKTKSQMTARFLIWSTSWVTDKCWMTISSVLSKDLQARRTLTWMNSIWSTKMWSRDCQSSKLSHQILLLPNKMSK